LGGLAREEEGEMATKKCENDKAHLCPVVTCFMPTLQPEVHKITSKYIHILLKLIGVVQASGTMK